MTSQRLCLLLLSIAVLTDAGAQKTGAKTNPDAAYTPLILKLNEDGSNYLRLLTWHQFWLSSSNPSMPHQMIPASLGRDWLRRRLLLLRDKIVRTQ